MGSQKNPEQPLALMIVSVSDQVEELWVRGKLIKECLRGICARQSSRIPQTQPQSAIIHLYS